MSEEIIPEYLPFRSNVRVNVLTPAHTVYIAKQLVAVMLDQGIECQVTLVKPNSGWGGERVLWLVICPQAYDELPAEYIAFQLEQTRVSNHFGDKNINTLRRAKFVLDYSEENVDYLKTLDISRIYHLPIGYAWKPIEFGERSFEYDVAFYGDAGCDRRRLFLTALERRFKVRVFDKCYGPSLINALSRARCVVNIHYYENALLETTRIYECLSNNFLVVSEEARDQQYHQELNGIVDFSPIGDIDAMVANVARLIVLGDHGLMTRLRENQAVLSSTPRWCGEGVSRLLALAWEKDPI